MFRGCLRFVGFGALFAVAAASTPAPADAQRAFREARFAASPFRPTPPVDPFDWRRPNPEAQSVANRPRPELDPLGLPAGPVRLYPSLTAGVVAEDNVRRAERGRRADIAFVASPSLYLLAERAEGRLELSFGADIYAYARTDSEDREDLDISLLAARQVGRDVTLAASGGFRLGHELRSSPDVGGADAPIRFRSVRAGAAATARFGRLRTIGDLRAERLDFDDVRLAGGGAFINNDDRDRYEIRAGVQPEFWNQAGDARIYARMEGAGIRYDDRADDGGFGRDSNGLELLVGLAAAPTGLFAGEVYLGYLGRFYEDDGPVRLNDDRVQAIAFGGEATWNMTGLTSFTGQLDRDLFETTQAGSPGGVATRLDIGADHELLRNLVLSAGVGGRLLDFKGIDREDYGLLFRFGGVYMINRHFGLEAGIEHERITSTGAQAGVDHVVNRIMLRATARP